MEICHILSKIRYSVYNVIGTNALTDEQDEALCLQPQVTIRLVQAFVISRLDYRNSVLAALPEITIRPLEHVQNAAARLIFGLKTFDHITPSLIQLHWLPVRWRIQYKLCLMMQTLLNLFPRSQRDVCDLLTALHVSEPSSARERSLSLDRPHGTLSLPTFAKKPAPQLLKRNLKHFISLRRLTATNIAYCFRVLLTIVMHTRSYCSVVLNVLLID